MKIALVFCVLLNTVLGDFIGTVLGDFISQNFEVHAGECNSFSPARRLTGLKMEDCAHKCVESTNCNAFGFNVNNGNCDIHSNESPKVI